MAKYIVTVNATSNSTLNTEDTWIELLPPSGVSIFITRITISLTHTTVQDVPCRLRVHRTSSAGATGSNFTPIKVRPLAPASSIINTSCQVKNGTSAFTVGTTVDVLKDTAFNSRGLYEWIPRDDSGKLESNSNQRLAILLRINAASIVATVEVEYEE